MLTEAILFDTLRQGLWVATITSIPILSAALVAGVGVGLFQALTSIQEMTLSFIPKLAVMALALAIFGEWQIAILIDYFETVFERIRTMTL